MRHPRHKAIRLWRKRHPIKVKITISEDALRCAFINSDSLYEFIDYLVTQMENKIGGTQ